MNTVRKVLNIFGSNQTASFPIINQLLDASGRIGGIINDCESEDHPKMYADKERMVRHYMNAYPGCPFVLFEQVHALCEEHGYMCIPLSGYKGGIPDAASLAVMDFKVADQDIWFSNYAYNIIEFNTSDLAMRRSLDQLRPRDSTHSPLDLSFKERAHTLVRMPFYVCTARALQEKAHQSVKDRHAIYESAMLYPVPYGFLIIVGWANNNRIFKVS